MQKRVAVLLAEGFEEIEAIMPIDVLRRAGVDARLVAVGEKKIITGAHNIRVQADLMLDDMVDSDVLSLDGVVIPGGLPGAYNLRDSEAVKIVIRSLFNTDKLVAAICAGPVALDAAGVLKGHKATGYPGFESEMQDADYVEEPVVVDGNVVTARGPAIATAFSLQLVEELCGVEKRRDIEKEILYNMK